MTECPWCAYKFKACYHYSLVTTLKAIEMVHAIWCHQLAQPLRQWRYSVDTAAFLYGNNHLLGTAYVFRITRESNLVIIFDQFTHLSLQGDKSSWLASSMSRKMKKNGFLLLIPNEHEHYANSHHSHAERGILYKLNSEDHQPHYIEHPISRPH